MTPSPAPWLETEDVAELLGMSPRTVRKYARELGGRRLLNARAWRFTRESVLEGAKALGLNLPEEMTGKEPQP